MKDGWEKQHGTDYYAYQAPDDINRNFFGLHHEGWGYAVAPTESNGITELDSGIAPVSPLWNLAPVLVPGGAIPAGIAGLDSSLDNHKQIISADEQKNRVVLGSVGEIIASSGGSR